MTMNYSTFKTWFFGDDLVFLYVYFTSQLA